MRKWKDEGNHILTPTQRKRYLIITIVLLIFPIAKAILIKKLYVFDIETIILALFIIWGIKCNGFYKIARYIAEFRLRHQKDNWR